MGLTALMFVILIVSFALMFALVKFTENIVAAPASAVDASATKTDVPANGS